jgi:hypothetical protein
MRRKMKRTDLKVNWALILVPLFIGCTGGGGGAPANVQSGGSLCALKDHDPMDAEYLVAPIDATASSADPNATASAVYDYGVDSHWRSAALGPQWITLDFGSPRAVTEVRLCVMQDQPGTTSHHVYGGLDPAMLEHIADLTGPTSSGQLLTIRTPTSSPAVVRYLKVQTSASPSTVAWGKIQISALPTNIPTYFGYYGDGFSWLTSATAEVIGHVNISWVSSDLANMSSLLASLAYAQNQGIKIALAIPPEVFFADDLTLAPQHQSNWEAFVGQIGPYADSVAFLYPIDEPYSQAKLIGIPAAEMKSRLEIVSSAIKSTFPAIPIAFSFSAIDFDVQDSAFADLPNPIPANYDWFGFDCYGSWESCGEPAYRSVHSVTWYVSKIKAKLDPNQKIFLFPDAFVREANPTDPTADAAEAALRVTRADKYFQLALSDPAIVGVFGFLYQDDYVEESQRFLGIRHWPQLQTQYLQMGRKITGK